MQKVDKKEKYWALSSRQLKGFLLKINKIIDVILI